MEPPVDQKLLEDFLSLCRHRSFSHAAQERNVTQPFSRRIRALEEWLGVVLFDRTALPVRLTAQGEQFLPVARDIVDRMAEARREFAAGNRSDGIVRLISLPTLSINVIFSSGCGRRAISSALWSIPFLKAWKSISAP